MTTKTETCGPVAKVGAEHKRLAPFEGVFKAQVKMWMGPGEPSVSTGVMRNEFDLGGLYLRQTYKGDHADGPFPSFEGRGYWGFNAASGKYEGFWIDNASSMMQTETGDVDGSGKVWTMTGEFPNPETGQMMGKRSVITLVDGDRHSLEMFFTTPSGQEVKAMEIQYQRSA